MSTSSASLLAVRSRSSGAPPGHWLDRIVHTSGDHAPLVARMAIAVVLFPHAAQKVFGAFGGPGLKGAMAGMGSMGIPAPLVALAIFTELLAPVALVLGLLSRVAALGVIVLMAVAVVLVHLPHGFFMNWYGIQGGEGFEYHLLMIALALVVFMKGSGASSLDRAIMRRRGGI